MYEFGPQHTAFYRYRKSVNTEWTTVVPRSAGNKTHACDPDQYHFCGKIPMWKKPVCITSFLHLYNIIRVIVLKIIQKNIKDAYAFLSYRKKNKAIYSF